MISRFIPKPQQLKLFNRTENVYINDHSLFKKVPALFEGIKNIGVIGWGSQGSAQAQNLRDSLKKTDINITVGLRKKSDEVEKLNFKQDSIHNVLKKSDLNILLISDYGQVTMVDDIMKSLKPNSTLGLSHGFLIKYCEDSGKKLRDDINIIGVCPKGMGKTVREQYVNDSGINSSIAVHQDVTGTANNIAVGWAAGIGSPVIYETTLMKECLSDLVGERSILLSAVQGMSESLFNHLYYKHGSNSLAYKQSVYNIIKKIPDIIKTKGLTGIYNELPSNEDKLNYITAYEHTYIAASKLINKIYEDVKSGDEIRDIIKTSKNIEKEPLYTISDSYMWNINNYVKHNTCYTLDGTVAGCYVGIMMAQIDVLVKNGHQYSEIINESIIEATDSLNPFMYKHGIDYMVDNCSLTARIGCRKWAASFDYMLKYEVLPHLDSNKLNVYPNYNDFTTHFIHDSYEQCKTLSNTNDSFLL